LGGGLDGEDGVDYSEYPASDFLEGVERY
jgi:hypothetical protein